MHKLAGSHLSIEGFLALDRLGFEPVGLVSGTSVYHIGVQLSNWTKNQELGALSLALNFVRVESHRRMRERAEALGADGVVGVETTSSHPGYEGLEITQRGTAVRFKAAPGRYRAAQDRAFTTHLGGVELASLLEGGFRPLGLVSGSCVYHVARNSFKQWFKTTAQNVEMTAFTQGFYEARELAMERMQQAAEALGAAGVVDTKVDSGSYHWESHVLEFVATGTAVAPHAVTADLGDPLLALSLDGR